MTTSFCRTILKCLLMLAALLVTSLPARATAIDGPIKLIVTYPPGGIGDIVARLVAAKMTHSIGQSIVVENRPGASGRIGVQFVKQAPADGRTLLVGNSATMVTGPFVWKNTPYDPVSDFVPVSQLFEYELALAVAPNVPVKNLHEYANWVATGPRNALFGSPAVGGLAHFLGLQLGRALKRDLVHIGYKGSAPLANDLMGGQIPAGIDTLDAQLRARKTRVLATAGTKRSIFLPEVPTFTELGYPGLHGVGWFGVFAPAHTPKPVVDLLSMSITRSLHDPEVLERMKAISYVPTGTTAEQFARILASDRDKWGTIIKSSGLVLEE